MRIEPRAAHDALKKDLDALTPFFDVLAMTSHSEGLPNVLLEAQWVGTPIVTTDAGGAGEAIFEGRTGLLGPNNDADAIATLACRILAEFGAEIVQIGNDTSFNGIAVIGKVGVRSASRPRIQSA